MLSKKFNLPAELNILLVLFIMAGLFEVLGWIFVGQSFVINPQRLMIIILQMSIIGIIAIGVTMVIVAGGIDLSSGSVIGAIAMISSCFAQTSTWSRVFFPALTDLPMIAPLLVALLLGALAGIINGAIIAYTAIPAFIVTLGMLVSGRGVAKWLTHGTPVNGFTDDFIILGSGFNPVWIFLGVALIAHIAMRYTRFGKYTYAIGSNMQAARVSGIDVGKHLIVVYSIAGLLSGLAGVVLASRAQTATTGMGIAYELDAITAAVIGGTSLAGGVGNIWGTVIGTLILGVVISGFTFIGVDAYYQEIIKGGIIVAAVIVDQYRQKKLKKL